MHKISIGTNSTGAYVDKKVHSQFVEFLGSCVSGGIWVGENSGIPNYGGLRKDVVDAMAKIAPPVIRWPGGCYADNYHWQDGIGPAQSRPVTYNSNFGTQAPEANHFGTHEFMRFCRMVGAQPWLNINMMSGTVAEMQSWAEYCNREKGTSLANQRGQNGDAEPFNVRYWGIGNEAWAGGGNYTAQGYAAEYRKFATAFPRFGSMLDMQDKRHPFLIAVGPDGNKPQERVRWTKDFFGALAEYRCPPINGYDLHFYNWNVNNPGDTVTEFDETGYYNVLLGCMELEEVICEQYTLVSAAIKNMPKPEGGAFGAQSPPECKLIVGEWGNWHKMDFSAPSALWQQVTMRDAITTALTLDIFHRNAEKLEMACVAQTVNVLNSLLLTFDDTTVLTPNYHVFDMYKPHRDAQVLPVEVTTSTAFTGNSGSLGNVYAFASKKDNNIYLNLVNTGYSQSAQVTVDIAAEFTGGTCLGGVNPQTCNTPQSPQAVSPQAAAPPQKINGGYRFVLPNTSVSVYHFSI